MPTHEQRALTLYIINNLYLYGMIQGSMIRLSQTHAYNEEPEMSAFARDIIHVAYKGAVQYNFDYNAKASDWREIFTFEDLQAVADTLATHYETEFRELIEENGIRDTLEAFRNA